MAYGGYQLLDFKGVALTSGTKDTTLTNIYPLIEGTNKRTIVTGLVVGATEYDDMEVVFIVSGDKFVGKIVVPGADDDGSILFEVEDDGVEVTVA